MIPNAIPPNTPPAIAAVLGVLTLSAFAIELVCTEASVAVLVSLGTPEEAGGSVLVRVMPPTMKEGEGGQRLVHVQGEKHQY